jgi:hypothetical protein
LAPSLFATFVSVVALTTGPWVRVPVSDLVTTEADTTARKTNETATARTAIFACVLPLALIKEWLSMACFRLRW